jgi:hypothetical protein
MTEQEVADLVEASRVAFNESVAAMGLATLDADAWNRLTSEPLRYPGAELTRWEDEQHPQRLCAWCFHPRNSDECQFAAKHTPYREMFGGS